MGLQQELGLKRSFSVLEHEAILNVYYTASLLKKKADEFFRQFLLTDVQFNVLMLLHYQTGQDEGLSQAQLSKMMLVNRANITSLIDRMEKADLVMRTDAAGDRRFNIVKLTAKGKKLFAKVEPSYEKMVDGFMNVVKQSEQKELIGILENIRGKITI
jgi:DNA-binding MarR family transcriptional regulator